MIALIGSWYAALGHGFLALAMGLMAVVVWGKMTPAQAARLSLGGFGATGISFCILIAAHVFDEFRLENVFLHSHRDTPLIYKVAGTWGNHEGALFLFILMQSFWVAYAIRRTYADAPAAGRWLAGIQLAWLVFVAFMADPFRVVPMGVVNGLDLNPALHSQNLAVHPPLLYLGSAALVLGLAGMMAGQATVWQRLRPGILGGMGVLTLGIGWGSFWAYHELGWGGWWFWDPIENVALLPWLMGAALTHSLVRRQAMPGIWTAAMPYLFVMIQAYIVRSNLLVSVHAFSADSSRGLGLLGIVALVVGMMIWAMRQQRQKKGLSARDLVPLLVFVALAGIVGIGTFAPLALEAMQGSTVVVGTDFFSRTFVPVALLGLIGMGWLMAGPQVTVVLSAVAVSLVLIQGGMALWAVGAIAVATWAMGATAVAAWYHPAGLRQGWVWSHMGVGLLVIAATVATTGERSVLLPLKSKASAAFDGGAVVFERMLPVQTWPGYKTESVRIRVQRPGATDIILEPYWKEFQAKGQTLRKTDIVHGLGQDYYAYLTIPASTDRKMWAVQVLKKPFMSFIWIAFILGSIGFWRAALFIRHCAEPEATKQPSLNKYSDSND